MMDDAPSRNIVVLGATGSIGRSALDVIAASGGLLRPYALTAHQRLDELAALAARLRPRFAIATTPDAPRPAGLPAETIWRTGPHAMLEVVQHEDVDTVLAAIVGRAGLEGTRAAIEAGKRVALANKETLVIAGPLMMALAAERHAELIPVDSEHSAVFQAALAGRRDEIERVVLTASGGPFRSLSTEELRHVTIDQALAHPTWNMGPKITVDSATMMNKALEIIEARWLFDLSPDQISVAVHPESIVHSMVEFVDGAVLAQLSPPDMRLPIQYALTYPQRRPSPARRLDWDLPWKLHFEPVDRTRFPAVDLGMQVARDGGTAGAVLNAANEQAVARFLDGTLGFHQIVPACRAILEQHDFDPEPTWNDLLTLDQWARQEMAAWNSAS